jgi:myosin heavy subunit
MQLAGLRLLAAAVIPIQAAMRMFLARRERLNRMWAVIVMQSYMRRWLCRQKYIADIDAVIAIQKTYRGWLARDLVEDQHYCATQIQRMVRGYMATLSVYESIYKVTLVQSYVRMKLAMDEATYRMALIIQVQSIIRGYLVRKGMELATTSATLVQAAWRGYYSCMTYQYDVLDIIIVQSLVRRRAARLCVEQKREDRMDRSATLIQAQWRSYDCTMNYLHYLADVLIVQSAVRRWRAERQYEDLLTLRDEEEARRKEIAAIQIQRCWRGFICYADYMFTVSDIVVVQSQIRRWLARRYLSRLKNVREVEAATNIQRHWRGSLGRDDAIMRLIEIIICQVSVTYYMTQSAHLIICISNTSFLLFVRVSFVDFLLKLSMDAVGSEWKGNLLLQFGYRKHIVGIKPDSFAPRKQKSHLFLTQALQLATTSMMRR